MPCQHMCSSGNLSDKGGALSPRDLARQSTTRTCAVAVCELGGLPRHLLNQSIFKDQDATKPLLLATKSRAGWLRSLLLPLGVHFYLHNYLNSPSLASTLLLVLLIRRVNSKTCLAACLPFLCFVYRFLQVQMNITVLYKNSFGEMETLCIHLTT